MQIAENLVRNGMAAGTAFMSELTNLISSETLTRIIETGTYKGTGTTAAVLSGIRQHGLKSTFVTIEVNPEHHAIAVHNLVGRPVDCMQGLSIKAEDLPSPAQIKAWLESFPETVIVDHQEANRIQQYFKETDHYGSSNLLERAMLLTSHYPDLVVLDSAGYMGTLEFNYLMSLIPHEKEFYLALDDTNHVKHYKTVQDIEANYRHKLIFSTDEKFGSRIYVIQANGSSGGDA
jgi:hypothetical protein